MKEFNTTAVCIPEENYMVDLSDRVKAISKLIDNKKYFIINRARQYGKTTTLIALERYLSDRFDVISIDFQDFTDAVFSSEDSFSRGFARIICDNRDSIGMPVDDDIYNDLVSLYDERKELVINDLFRIFDKWCRKNEKPLVLIIDEVDSATNNSVFLDFLGKLRSGYLKRQKKPKYKTFQSVILSGVTDVKHLKLKIRQEDEKKVNSPWNIAADFDIDMSLSESGIKEMLNEYDKDHNIGMDTELIARVIREYTNGYPYLVSRICELIDLKLVPSKFKSLKDAWTESGVEEAIKMMLQETGNPLFDSLTGKLSTYPELKKRLRSILLNGETFAWLPYDEEQQQLYMFGFIRNNHNTVAVSNRIFERMLYTHFIGESDRNNDLKQYASEIKPMFVNEDGSLDLPKIMEHFIIEHNRIHGENSEEFLENEGRERFITYISAIINGTGTYDIEPQTRNHKRMDLVIHYLGRRYIVEMKIWHGDRYNEKGEKQICEYLDYFGLNTGYMLSFNFNKKKKSGVEKIHLGNKILFEGTV